MSRILIYSTQFCGYCQAAKRLLRGKGLDFEEVDVGFEPDKRAEMVERSQGARTVPQIFIHDRHVGGYEELAELVAKGLKTAGYDADVLSTVEEARAVLSTTFYAAMILDLGLPDGDGLELLREIRQRDNPIPVLVLTARGGLTDRVHGLRSGADDYLVKPFALEELVARLEAQLRRPGQLLGSSLRIANLAFDTQNRQASIDDQPQLLSARETAVLELLMRSKGRVVSKKQVEDHIFGHSGEVASNAIEVYVHRLRKQLSERGARVQVHTIRGVGYLIAEEK